MPCTAIAQLNETWLENSSFVFVGTVEETGRSTVAGIEMHGTLVIVKIVTMQLKPASVSLPKSNLVTVLLAEGSEVEVGADYRFYGLGIVFGSELAIEEVGHEAPEPVQEDIESRKRTLVIASHLKLADLIALGTVLEIREPKTEGPVRDSEHNPEWKEAIVALEEVLRGPEAERVIIRFPSSDDVAWWDIPKLQRGQKATFVVAIDTTATGLKGGVIDGNRVGTYVIIKPLDVLTEEEFKQIQNLLRKAK